MSYGYLHDDIKTEHTDELEAIGQTMRLQPVNRGTRFIHALVDGIFFSILSYFAGMALGLFLDLIDPNLVYQFVESNLLNYLFSYSLYFLYFFILESTTGQTIGKMLTKTKVIAEDGSKPTSKAIAYRSLSRLIPFEPFSFLGSTPTGWHDRISKTYVTKIQQDRQYT